MIARVRFNSIEGRLGLTLAFISVLVFSVIGLLLHTVLEHVLEADEEADLLGKRQIVQRFLDEVRSERDLPLLRSNLETTSVAGHFRWHVWVVRPDETVVFGVTPLPPTVQRGDGKLWLEQKSGVNLRASAYLLDSNTPVLPRARVVIGLDPGPRAEMLARYDRLSIALCVMGVLASAGLSLVATRRGLVPVRALSEEAAKIRPGAYLTRLPLPENSAELVPLVECFNEVLGRMESAWSQLEGFNADVAHELRTPLAVLISGAELGLSPDRSAAEMREVIEMQLEELRHMASMVNDMLFLARADRGVTPDNLESISMRDEAVSAGDFVEALLDNRSQHLVVDGDAQVFANRTLIRRALVNLIINGARHAAEGSRLVVLIVKGDDEVVQIVVRNPGAPIPSSVQQRMFNRFWRGENSRAKSDERYGLGLAIVKAIGQMHGGHTLVRSNDGTNDVGFTLRA